MAKDGAGRWRADLSTGWNIGARPNGGYVVATAVRAMGEAIAAESGHPHPLTVTAHFLRPGEAGPADIDVDVLRTGRRLSTATAALAQRGKERIQVLATFGDLDAAEGPTALVGAPPPLPPVEQCVARTTDDGPFPAEMTVVHRLDTRLHPSTGWVRGEPNGVAEIRAYIRFADGREPDVWAIPFLVDSLPPAVFELGFERVWVPTIELTIHVRAKPAPGWLRMRTASPYVINGFLNEDCEIWDSADNLVATSRQLGMFFRP